MSDSRDKVMQAAEKYVARGKLDQAIREYRKLLRYNPKDANTLNRVGDLYARQSNVGEAVRLFMKKFKLELDKEAAKKKAVPSG